MDLEKLNGEYVKLKIDLEKVKQDINNLENTVNYLASDKIIWTGKLEEAKRNKDDIAKNSAENELKRINQDLKKAKEDTEKKRDELNPLKEKIDDIIKKIKEDPEMAKHLNEVMAKKYDRKISKLEKEKEELEGKKDKYINLKQLVTDHPALANNLKGILVAQKEINDLNKELESLKLPSGIFSDPARADEIKKMLLPQAKKKLDNNKAPLMSYIAKKNLGITEQDIAELANQGFETDSKGNIDLNRTMDKRISSINRQIKGHEKSIRDHQSALGNINIDSRTSAELRNPPAPIEPKWYQLGARLKNWYERSSNPLVERFRNWREGRSGTPTPTTPADDKKNVFKDSLKYEVVRDLVDQVKEEDLKQAKIKRKEEDRTI